MRDENRIEDICQRLAATWHKVSDWRLSQLMSNAFIVWHNQHGSDAFYAEDDEFIDFLENFINEATQTE